MAIGSITKSAPSTFNITKGKSQHNEYEASASTSNKPQKEPAKTDPKKEKNKPSFGPGGTVAYGTGEAVYDGQVSVVTLQDTTAAFGGTGGSGAYSGQTQVLEARARGNKTVDLNIFDDGKLQLGIDGQAQANLFRTDHGVDYKSPVARIAGHDAFWAEAHANGGAFAGAQIDGKLDLNLSFSMNLGFKGRVGAFAGALVRVEGEVRGYVAGASAGVHARGEAWAGAQAWAEASLGLGGLKASAGAFAGAAAGGAIGADIMGVGVEASGTAWAGVGAKAGVNVSWEDGKFEFGAEAGAAMGVGAAGGINVTIDTERLIKDGTALWDNVGGEVSKAAGDAYTAAAGWVGDAADAASDDAAAAGEAVEDIADAVGDGVAAAVDALENGAEAAGQAAGDAWNWLTGQ